MKSRSHRYRVYLLSLMLMAIGVLFQALLLTGHLPHIHLGLHPAAADPFGSYAYQKRNQDASPVVRMDRPTFETGMIFPQWGQMAYSERDNNWQIGLSDIQQQTASQWIELPINFYQSTINSKQVIRTNNTPTPQAVATGIQIAHAKHYKVFVVPFITVTDPRGYTWSGSIQFNTLQETEAWFANYWYAYQPYISAAAQAGAEQLAVGTEDELLQQAPATLWDQLIAQIHQIFHGKLTYDINWSSLLLYPLPPWLRNTNLSAIGVSVYNPLTDTPQRLDPNKLPALWQQTIGKMLDNLAAQIHKPILVSEIGYRNSVYALYKPWLRDLTAQSWPPDPTEQAAAYNAALTNVLSDKHITGIFFWAWSIDLFQPNYKPAAQVLHKWYTSPMA